MKKHALTSNVVFIFPQPFARKAQVPEDSPAKPVQSDSQRRAELARLLPLWPHEIADLSCPGRQHILRTLERALRVERRRGRAGHWAYDLARHAALFQTWRRERAALRAMEMTAVCQNRKGPPRGEPL